MLENNLERKFKIDLKEKHKILNFLLPIMLLVIMTLTTALWTIPKIISMYNEWSFIEEDRDTLESVLKAKRNILNKANSGEIDSILTLTREAIPEAPVPTYVLALVDQITVLSNTKIVDIWYEPTEGLEERVLSINVEITGTKSSIIEFLNIVHRTVPILRVRNFTFLTSPYDEGLQFGVDYTASFLIDSPYAPFPETIGTVDSSASLLSSEEEGLLENLQSFLRFSERVEPTR
ncbi:hypothetical protein KC571_01530 [candidate division WWE3 bacterium]|uniref:Type 4a pilus biogenesis protein PilO n=1 Tax=candidate division WWE3 bacterium TaxID=2053526 RepID=A0A955RPZ0_UNCKA|nr:hypothetical protein [candidate division WWE3 bacterium]